MQIKIKFNQVIIKVSSVDMSVPTILRHQVRIPFTPSMFVSAYIWFVWFEKDEIKQKDAGIGPYF